VAIEVSVWVFNIATCGYYESAKSKKGAPALFGGISDCLAGLGEWTYGKRLSETSTYSPLADSETGQAFFLCLEKGANGDFLLGLWNKIQTNSNKIASVGVNDIVGQVVTEITEIDEDRIPGYATYFYFMPAEGKVATVRVKHPLNGLYNLKAYIKNFMMHINPKHVVLGDAEEGSDEIPVIGYREHPGSPDILKLRSRFRLESIARSGEKEFLVANSPLCQSSCRVT
jgi:hypothetical protein